MKANKKLLITLLKAAVSVAFIVFLVVKVDYSSLKSVSAVSIAPSFVVSLVVSLLALYAMSVRWSKLVGFLAGLKVSIAVLFSYYLKGAFYNVFLPGAIGGDVYRTRELKVSHNVDYKRGALITLIERFSGLYVLFVVGSLGLSFVDVPAGFRNMSFLHTDYIYLIPLTALLALPLLKFLVDKKVPLPFGVILQTLLFSFLGQLGDIVIAYIFARFFSIPVDFMQFFIIMPIVYVVTVLPISIGGLGVREGVFVGILSLYGVDSSVATVISFSMYFVKVMLGAIGWGFVLKSKRAVADA